MFQITSKDVIHSIFLPNTRRKVDAMPGRISRMWVQLKKEGKWNIVCAEMCGIHHYLMKGYLTTYSQHDFDKWFKTAQGYALAENDPDNPNQFWGWEWK
jgi:cytochrome c oxidase subunit 2